MNNVLKYILPVTEYFVGSLMIYGLLWGLNCPIIIYAPISTPAYQEVQPIGFILFIGFAFALSVALLPMCLYRIKKVRTRYFIFYLIWLLISCFLCTCYWLYIDANGLLGYLVSKYPGEHSPNDWSFIFDHIKKNLNLLWDSLAIVMYSIPCNVLLFALSFFILRYNKVLKQDS